jgi:ADP-L-glycero-D-manno-heptose 6-epimerase
MRYIDDDLDSKTILITGGAGFIGSNLAFYFQENHPNTKVVIVDKFRSTATFSNGNLKSFGHFKNIIGFLGEVISGDINNPSTIDELTNSYRFDYIFHQAAISDTTVVEQDLMIKTNVNAYGTLLKMAKKHNATMIYASSAATYGDSDTFKVGFERPNNVYGFSKLAMDNLTYKHMQDQKIVGLRYFNVYGKREFFKNKTASTVVQFGHQLLRGDRVKLFEGSDKILRDFIYIDDVIQANIKAMVSPSSGVYNVGTGKARSFQDIADSLQKELGINRNYEYIKNPFIGSYQFFTQADIEDSIRDLDFKPRFELEDGIRAYIPEIKRLFKGEVDL